MHNRRSTATPWTLIVTSSAPAAAPIAAVHRTSAPNDSANAGATIAALTSSPPAVTTGALPRREASAPASGWAISKAIVSASSAKPMSPVAQVQPVLDRRQPGEERRDDEAVEREEDRDRGARAHAIRRALGSLMVATFPAG